MFCTLVVFYYFSLNQKPDIPYLGEFVVMIAPTHEDLLLNFNLKQIVEKFTHIKTKDLVELIAEITKNSKKKVYTEVIKLIKV